MLWDDTDNPLTIFVSIIAILVGMWFVCTQYEICLAMPDNWFCGMVSGLIFGLCLWLLFRRRE